MRACIQRVQRAAVRVDGTTVGSISQGLLVLLGVAQGDTQDDVRMVADKTVALRVFEDADGKMNLSVADVRGSVLVVSQFTLLGDCRRGRRPSFSEAADPVLAERLYEAFAARIAEMGIEVARGKFRAHMEVELVNDGPVTLMVESR